MYLPVERQKIIEQSQILQRDGDLGIGIIAGDRVENAIGGTSVGAAVRADDCSAASPDARCVGIRKQHLVNDRMMAVADVDGVEAGDALAAALREHSVQNTVHQVEAPVFRIRCDELHGSIAHHAAAEVEAVQGPLPAITKSVFVLLSMTGVAVMPLGQRNVP